MEEHAASPGSPPDEPWAAVLDSLCVLFGRVPMDTVSAVGATISLDARGTAALRLMRACEELERRHGLRLDVGGRSTARAGAATFVVRIRRRSSRPHPIRGSASVAGRNRASPGAQGPDIDTARPDAIL